MTIDTIKRTLRFEATSPLRPTVFNMHHTSLNALDEYRLPKKLRWYIADEDTLRTYMLLVAEAL